MGKLLLASLGILLFTIGVPAVLRHQRTHLYGGTTAVSSDELPLRVEHEGKALRLRWDSNASALRSASRAALYISDGKLTSQLNLNRGNLDSGSAVYWPETNKENIAFRLELTLPDRRVERSIVASAASPEPAYIELAASTLAPAVVSTRQVGGLSRNGERRSVEEKVRRPEALPTRETDARPSPLVEPPPAHAGAQSADRAAPPGRKSLLPATRPSTAAVEVRAEPLPPSRSGGVIRSIPVLRRLRKTRGALVATPLRQIRPLELPTQRVLAMPVNVDVRVDIDESGKVTAAEAEQRDRHPEFADAAVDAARKWQFSPARVGNEEVPAKAILHFRFDPTNH